MFNSSKSETFLLFLQVMLKGGVVGGGGVADVTNGLF